MAPLVGRAGTLSVLGGRLDAAAQGRGGCVVVEGPLGIGRSRLLRATAREGAERGLTVVGGRAGASGGTPASEGVAGGGRPFPVHLLTNYLRRVLSTDVDDLVRPDGNPFRLMDRVGELVETAARRHPLVVLLDDVHRVDDMGGLALRGLVQSLAGSPVLWLLTRRPVATRSLTQHAVDRLIDGAAVRLHLGALDNEAVAELCTGLLGAKPDSSVLGWAARCGGNPWLLTRVFDALVTAGRVVFVDGTAAVLGEQLPDAVLDTVRKLVDGLPPAMARLLVAGAGIGEAFTAAQAAAPAASADEAVRTGLLQRHGEELAFAHGVVAEALRHPALRRTGPAVGRPTAAGEALAGPAQASGTPEAGGSAQPPGPVMAPGQMPAHGPAAASGAPRATGPTPAYDLAQASAPVPTAAPAAAPGTRQATGPLPAYDLAQASGPVSTSGAAAAPGSPQTHDPVPTPGPAQASGPVPTAGPAAASGTPQATGPAPAYAQASASGAAPDRVPDAYRRQPRPLPPEDSPAVPPPAAVCGCEGTVAAAVTALADRSGAAPRALVRALRLLTGAGRAAEAGRLADVAVRSGIDVADIADAVGAAGPTSVMNAAGAAATGGAAGVAETADAADAAQPAAAPAGAAGRLAARAPAAPPRVTPGGDAGLPGTFAAPAATAPAAPALPATAPAAPALPATAAGVPAPVAAARCETCARPLWTWLARALVAADAFEEAAAVCDAVRQEAGRRGGPWPEALWHGHRAELLAAAGRLEEARGEAETALGLADRTEPEDLLPARLVLARIALHCGDLATASQQLRMAERPAGPAAAAVKPRLDWALAGFHAASGRAAMTVRSVLDAEDGAEPDPLLFAEAPAAAATLVRLAGQMNLGAEAGQAAGFARRLAERNPDVTSLTAAAAHADGVLRDDLDGLRRAAELYRLAGRPLAAGGALEDAARHELAAHRKEGAAQLLAAAAELYLDCGAQRDTARVQRKLRRLGAPHPRPPGAHRPRSGWDSLTGAELRVVRAIVDGRTNREAAGMLFLSPHTVDSHLRRVFAKLDINSRVELTKQFLAHEAVAPGGATAPRQLAAAGPEPPVSSPIE